MNKSRLSDSLRDYNNYVGRPGGSVSCAFIIVAITAIIAFGFWQSSLAEAQSSAGTATGMLTINGKGIPLKHS